MQVDGINMQVNFDENVRSIDDVMEMLQQEPWVRRDEKHQDIKLARVSAGSPNARAQHATVCKNLMQCLTPTLAMRPGERGSASVAPDLQRPRRGRTRPSDHAEGLLVLQGQRPPVRSAGAPTHNNNSTTPVEAVSVQHSVPPQMYSTYTVFVWRYCTFGAHTGDVSDLAGQPAEIIVLLQRGRTARSHQIDRHLPTRCVYRTGREKANRLSSSPV